MKRYRLLNEVLIEWNESSNEGPDNVFLKSKDIKKSLERYFVYKLNEKDQIKVFDIDWPEFEKYKDKVWINGKHVELNGCYTIDMFEPGKYKVYIEDIDKVTDMTYMFYDCKQLVSAFIPNFVTSISDWAFVGCSGLMSIVIGENVTVIGYCVFESCSGLTSVTIPNSVTSISNSAFSHCNNLKTVYVEDINKFKQINFADKTAEPRCYGAKLIELKK